MDLVVASEFSEIPVCGWITHDDYVIPVVACGKFVLPKDCFIQLWFWSMANARIYSNLWDKQSWNPVLQDLNSHLEIPQKFKHDVMDWIVLNTLRRTTGWTLDFKVDQFERIIQELQETAPV